MRLWGMWASLVFLSVACAKTAESDSDQQTDAAQSGSSTSAGGATTAVGPGGAAGAGGEAGAGATCPDGWGDCDDEPLNGCEVNIKTNASNCGACGEKCPFGEASYATCIDAMCELVCTQGYQDCDGDAETGCEAHTASDPVNCGACGVLCHGTCSDGACDPDDLATGRLHPTAIELSATHVYWSEMGTYPYYNDGGVLSVPLAGGAPTKLATTATAAFGLAVDATHAYYTERGSGNLTNGVLSRVPLAGGTAEVLATNLFAPSNVVVDATHVYWTNAGAYPAYIDGSINRVPLAGGTVEVIASGMYKPFFLAVNDTDVYWTNSGQEVNMFTDGALYKAPKVGGMATKLEDGSLMYGVVLDATNVYYNETGKNTLWRKPLAGGSPTALATGQQNNIFLTQAADDLHWANFGIPDMNSGTIRSVPKMGGNIQTAASNQGTPYDIEVDATHVYWANYGTQNMNDGGVHRMPL
ncbi:MAG: hypothetical protein VB934_14205 [Polyangiaceae bacterium]